MQPILLKQSIIQSLLKNHGVQIDILDEVGSTNDYLKDGEQRGHDVVVCIAEKQTAGRGRFDRQWHSPFGENIYFSMRYRFSGGGGAGTLHPYDGLSIMVGLSICSVIESVTNIKNLALKWPNDVVCEGKKISGILIELQAQSSCAIIGIGINVNMEKVNDTQINQPWNSLKNITGKPVDRNVLCAKLIDRLIENLTIFSNTGLRDFMQAWQKRDCLFDKPVQLMVGEKKIMGISHGINARGNLMLKMPDQTVRAFASGEVTLKH